MARKLDSVSSMREFGRKLFIYYSLLLLARVAGTWAWDMHLQVCDIFACWWVRTDMLGSSIATRMIESP